MKQKVSKYFSGIALPKAISDRAQECIDSVTKLYGVDYEDVFISTVKKEEGELDYLSLWLISNERVIECKEFVTRFDIDLAFIPEHIKYFNIKSNDKNLDLSNVESSRLMVRVVLIDNMSCTLQAFGNNCPYLMEIAKKYFIQRFR